MPTSNPRNISVKTHKMLWGRAASRCAFPDCRRELVMESTAADDASLFGEACHMVAKEPEGPRGNSPLTSKQRDEYDNLLLLCNIHHKVIDDQPNTYPIERLKMIKTEHERWVRESLQGRSPIWSVPYQRNGLFTGREDLLNTLHDRLTTTKSTALTQPQAISGLGGIGKTQIALEYAYSYRDSYHAVFWVRAATRETLLLDYVSMAGLLRLPEKDEQDQNITVLAVKRWLAENTNWLLILDNADELEVVHDFLPAGSRGHTILTTRASTTRGFATRLEVDKMEKKEGILFLLRCAKVLRPEELLEQATSEQQIHAEAIVNVLDGLPLALDQAGAYIEETKCNLAEYLAFYQVHRKELLRQRGTLAKDYPASVATTWSLSFQQVERDNPAAADLLRMFAFLDPDAIPEEIVVKGASHLGPLLVTVASDSFLLLAAMKRLGAFSLVQRNAEKRVLRIHRLVQAVLRDDMTQEIQKIWAERVVKSVNEAFPFVDVTTWEQCKSYISHAQECTDLIKNFDFAFPEAARLLNQTATYYEDHALYSDAEPLLQRALSICEQVLGPQHPDTASSLNNLAYLYDIQGKYELAEPLLQRALSIREQVLGPQHPNTASSLNNLAALYEAQGKYELAEPLLQRALSIREQVLGPQHPDTASSLNNLAALYKAQGKYELAEPLLQRALSIYEQVLGPQHPDTALSLNNLAALYEAQGKYELAEPLYERALSIYEQVLGPQHPNTALSLNNLAALYDTQGKYELAEPLYERALSIYEQVLGPQHPNTALSLNNLAYLYKAQGKYELAEPLLQRALSIREQVLGPQHPNTASSLNNLAALYDTQGKYELAEPLYERALSIYEQVLGPQHPDTALSLNNLAYLYKAQGKYELAEPLLQRALSIREQVLGPQHPNTALSLNNLAYLYEAQGKYELAEPLLQRALSIYEQALGPQHPSTIIISKNYTALLSKLNKTAQTEN